MQLTPARKSLAQERVDKLVFLYMNTRALSNKYTEEECPEDVEAHIIHAEDKEMDKWLRGSAVLGKRPRDEED